MFILAIIAGQLLPTNDESLLLELVPVETLLYDWQTRPYTEINMRPNYCSFGEDTLVQNRYKGMNSGCRTAQGRIYVLKSVKMQG